MEELSHFFQLIAFKVFDNSDLIWYDEYTPVDLAENHDKYLYNDEY